MKNTIRMGALIAVAAALVVGCDSESTSGATPSVSTTQAPVTQTPSDTEPAPGTSTVVETPSATADPTTPADDISGSGLCLDPSSTGVQNALAGLEGSWVAGDGSTDQPGNCGNLLWLRAIGGNSAGAPIHVLFFHDGKYLGTGTSEPYAFTSVVGSSSDAVTVNYRWLVADEPFAAPQGGPATITYSWTGSGVTMSGPLPSEVTQPHR
ncbi:LppP/LprE family lipoprotein [Nocardia lasii]|uniref:LppP/LprE family lipoprotein n=1 Tax=Nocardia lasii TaxID=1616107 RepID=A0ABW1JPT0_9NOCA